MKREIKQEETGESNVPKPVESILQYQSIHRIITHYKEPSSNSLEGPTLSAHDKILRRSCTNNFIEPKTTCTVDGEQILNLIIEPRIVSLGKELFVQDVSSCPGKTLDVIHLQEKLNSELTAKGAQKTGICSIRRKLYGELFKEIIRQVTIECMERGLLLSRVNNELNLSLIKIRQIYESNIGYGMNKTLRGERNRNNNLKNIDTLTQQIEDLKVQLMEVNKHVDATQEREQHKFTTLKKKFDIDIIFMKKNYDQLKQQLIEAIEFIKHPEMAT